MAAGSVLWVRHATAATAATAAAAGSMERGEGLWGIQVIFKGERGRNADVLVGLHCGVPRRCSRRVDAVNIVEWRWNMISAGRIELE